MAQIEDQKEDTASDLVKITIINGSYGIKPMKEELKPQLGTSIFGISKPEDIRIKCNEFDILKVFPPDNYKSLSRNKSNSNTTNQYTNNNAYNSNKNGFKMSVRVLAPTKTENYLLKSFCSNNNYKPITKLCQDNNLNVRIDEGLPAHYRSVGYELCVSRGDHLPTYTVHGSLSQLANAFKSDNIPKFHHLTFGYGQHHNTPHYMMPCVASMRIEFGQNKANAVNQFMQLLFRCNNTIKDPISYDFDKKLIYIKFQSLDEVSTFLVNITDKNASKQKISKDWKIMVQSRRHGFFA